MEFGDLPEEVLIEQFKFLSPDEIVATCQTNRQFAGICQGKRLWQTLVRDRYPQLDIGSIQDPRDFYYKTFVLGQGVYANFRLQPIPIDLNTKENAKMLADSSQVPYVIAYGSTEVDPYSSEYNIKGFQTSVREVPPKSQFSEVDIFTTNVLPPRLQAYLAALNDADPRATRATINVSYPENGIVRTESLSLSKLSSNIRRDLREFIFDGHQKYQTPLYMNALARFNSLRETPQIPPLPGTRTGGDLTSRKLAIINLLVNSMSENEFNRNHGNGQFLGFKSYQEFSDAQSKLVNLMDESQIQTIEFIRDQLTPKSAILEEESGILTPLSRFVLDVGGRLVFISPR